MDDDLMASSSRRPAAGIRALDQDAPTPRSASDAAPKGRERKTDGKVRTTVVLDADEYHSLGELCLDLERRTGRRGVASSEVVRVLLGIVTRTNDPESDALRVHLADEIARNGGNRRGRT